MARVNNHVHVPVHAHGQNVYEVICPNVRMRTHVLAGNYHADNTELDRD